MHFLKKRSEYLLFHNCDKTIRSQFFILAILENREQADFSLGITVSKKVGNAVTRNLVKRRVKAWLRETKKTFPVNTAVNIIALNKVSSACWNNLYDDLEKLFKRLSPGV